MRSIVGVWLSACTIRFRKASLSLIITKVATKIRPNATETEQIYENVEEKRT